MKCKVTKKLHLSKHFGMQTSVSENVNHTNYDDGDDDDDDGINNNINNDER